MRLRPVIPGWNVVRWTGPSLSLSAIRFAFGDRGSGQVGGVQFVKVTGTAEPFYWGAGILA